MTMRGLHYKYVLVGGGIASSAAAVAIRQIDRSGAMLLVGQEINRPYDRSPLSKGFLKHIVRHDELFTLPDDWLRANGCDGVQGYLFARPAPFEDMLRALGPLPG